MPPHSTHFDGVCGAARRSGRRNYAARWCRYNLNNSVLILHGRPFRRTSVDNLFYINPVGRSGNRIIHINGGAKGNHHSIRQQLFALERDYNKQLHLGVRWFPDLREQILYDALFRQLAPKPAHNKSCLSVAYLTNSRKSSKCCKIAPDGGSSAGLGVARAPLCRGDRRRVGATEKGLQLDGRAKIERNTIRNCVKCNTQTRISRVSACVYTTMLDDATCSYAFYIYKSDLGILLQAQLREQLQSNNNCIHHKKVRSMPCITARLWQYYVA